MQGLSIETDLGLVGIRVTLIGFGFDDIGSRKREMLLVIKSNSLNKCLMQYNKKKLRQKADEYTV